MNIHISLNSKEAIEQLLGDKKNEVMVTVRNKALKNFASDLVDERVVGWIRNELIEKIEKESTSIITDGCFLSSLSSHTKEAISKYTKEAVDTAVLETRRNIIKELTAMLNNSQTIVETIIKARIEKEFNTNIKALIQQAIKAELKSYFTQGE
ncbi:hypothetical protein [Treponema socranskii]|uniref:hypothetical protein n=1 Tax=Treponema socranskii TaxID=53419 RepID=UPI003D90686D